MSFDFQKLGNSALKDEKSLLPQLSNLFRNTFPDVSNAFLTSLDVFSAFMITYSESTGCQERAGVDGSVSIGQETVGNDRKHIGK